jgi:hypothetical protein
LNNDDERQVESEDSKPARGASPSNPDDRDPVANEIERETERASDAPITESSSDDSRS